MNDFFNNTVKDQLVRYTSIKFSLTPNFKEAIIKEVEKQVDDIVDYMIQMKIQKINFDQIIENELKIEARKKIKVTLNNIIDEIVNNISYNQIQGN